MVSLQSKFVGTTTSSRLAFTTAISPPVEELGPRHRGRWCSPDNKKAMLVFMCIPVSPGRRRLIYAVPRNFDIWMDLVVPPWVYHMGQNLILDSGLYLLHLEERKLKDVGAMNWQKACYVPTKADALIVAFRRWLNKYGGAQVDWRGK